MKGTYGMNFDHLESALQNEGIIFLCYGGALTQQLISGMTDALEKEVSHNDLSMKISNNIFTIFIELSQNLMNYTNAHPEISETGLIIVGMSSDSNHYYIISRNRISDEAKTIIEERLNDVEGKDRDELRALYREKRKANRLEKDKGAGIGFIEIARRCDKIEHHFQPIGNGNSYFTVKTTIAK